MKTGSTDALVAVLEAAQSYTNHLAARELPPKNVLRMAFNAALASRATLNRVGMPQAIATPSRRDDTDELLGRALGTGLPFDEGPEGPADTAAPLSTDETSDDLVSFPSEPDPVPVDVEYDPDSVGGAYGDEEITHKSSTGDEPDLESFDLVDEETQDGPTSTSDDPLGELLPDPVSEDSPSVSEVIVTKQDAAAEIASLRASATAGPAVVAVSDIPDSAEDHVDTEDHGVIGDDENTLSTHVDTLSSELNDTQSSEVDDEVEDTQSAVVKPAPNAVPVAGIAMGGRAVAEPPQTYGANVAVPTIRDQSTPKPRAAAIQLGNEEGESVVLGMEEEDEPIAVGGAEDDEDYDFDPDEYDPDAGFQLQVEEYEEYDEDDEEDELEPEPEPEPEPTVELPEVDIAGSLKRGAEAAENGDLDDAIDLYSDVLDADYENVSALVGRGRAYLVKGDFARAMSDFTIAGESEPENPEPLIAIGDLYFERKDYKSAIEYYDSGLQADPSHALGFCRRGISHYSRKDYTTAVKDLTKAKELDPELANIKTYISMAKKKARR